MARRGKHAVIITLSDDRRRSILRALGAYYHELFDETISPFQSEQLLAFFIDALGPEIYNQAVQDARHYMIEKLDDLETECYIKDVPKSGC